MGFVIDLLILFGLISGALIGLRRGFFAQTINFVGFILALVIAFLLKNVLSAWLMPYLPFLNFNDIIIFNVLFYEILAFLLIFGILLSILKVIMKFTDIFEALLKYTVVLGIPSKVLGAVVGLLQAYIIVVFVVIFFWQPALSVVPVQDSRLANGVIASINNRLSPMNGLVETFKEITDVEEIGHLDNDQMNLAVLDIMLDRGVTKVSLIDNLVERGKLPIENIESVLSKHR